MLNPVRPHAGPAIVCSASICEFARPQGDAGSSMISGDFQMTATMRRILSCVFVVLAFAAVVPAAAQSAAPFRRGISLFHPLISAKLQPGSKTAFVFPPFADAGHQLTS